jgi:hypothetical protein
MSPTQKRTLQFGEWVIDDLRLQTDELPVPFCCTPTGKKRVTDAVDRTAALSAMYVRLLEQAENLGLLRIGESAQVKRWLTSGVLFR